MSVETFLACFWQLGQSKIVTIGPVFILSDVFLLLPSSLLKLPSLWNARNSVRMLRNRVIRNEGMVIRKLKCSIFCSESHCEILAYVVRDV